MPQAELYLIIAVSLASIFTRFPPFLFGKSLEKIADKKLFKDVLPFVVMLFLVGYCYRDISTETEYFVRIFFGLFTITLHLKFKNFVASILLGTLAYTFVVNYFSL